MVPTLQCYQTNTLQEKLEATKSELERLITPKLDQVSEMPVQCFCTVLFTYCFVL